jgi:hypothetical protein
MLSCICTGYAGERELLPGSSVRGDGGQITDGRTLLLNCIMNRQDTLIKNNQIKSNQSLPHQLSLCSHHALHHPLPHHQRHLLLSLNDDSIRMKDDISSVGRNVERDYNN